MRKRVLCIMLAFMMMISMMPVTALAANEAGDSGDSEGVELHKLSAPDDLLWDVYYGPEGSFANPGVISWTVTDTAYTATYRITLYKNGDMISDYDYYYRSGRSENCMNYDFMLHSLEYAGDGTYYFTVQALGDGITTSDSEIVQSDLWTYTAPATRVATPVNARWNGGTAEWEASADPNAGGYSIEVYYSETNAEATEADISSLTRTQDCFVWFFGEGSTAPTFTPRISIQTEGTGYYYFKVQTVSKDVHTAWHSEFTTLSDAYYYDAAANGYQLTYEYDADMCDLIVSDANTGALVEDGILPINQASGSAYGRFQIANIAEGYRIKAVYLNAVDVTSLFLSQYGVCSLTITENSVLKIELEEIPADLPKITGVSVVSMTGGQLGSEPLTEVVFEKDRLERLQALIVFEGDGDYPDYYAGGLWQYSVDNGETWKDLRSWGSNRMDFWAAWPTFETAENFDFLNESYLLRVKITPLANYSTVESGVVYSAAIAVNGETEVLPTVPAVETVSFSAGTPNGVYLTWTMETPEVGEPTIEAIDSLEFWLYNSTKKMWEHFYTGFTYQSSVCLTELAGASTLEGEYTQIRIVSMANGFDQNDNPVQDATYIQDIDLTITQQAGSGGSATFAEENTGKLYAVTMSGLTENKETALYVYKTSVFGDANRLTGPLYHSAVPSNPWTSYLSTETGLQTAWYTLRQFDSSVTDSNTADITIIDLSGWKLCLSGSCETHELSEYMTSSSGHWQECTVCEYVTETEYHVIDNDAPVNCADGIQCTVCEYYVLAPAAHSWLDAWESDDLKHWHACERCDMITGESAHDVVTDSAVPPTATSDGKTEGSHCSVCEKVLVEQNPVPALSLQEVSWLTDTITWTYGDRETVTNTAYNDSEDGGTLTYSGNNDAVALVDSTTGAATIVGAGTVQITATAAATDRYVETSASYTLTINKASLTVTASDAAIEYGEIPANTGWTAVGFVYDDSMADLRGTAVYTYQYEQFDSVGAYQINVSGLQADHYEITYASGTLTVNPAAEHTITLGNLEQRTGAVTPVTTSVVPQDSTAVVTVEYLVENTWTTMVPAVAGEYEVRASLTDSDHIEITGAYFTGKLIINQGVVVDDTDVSLNIDDNKAEIVVTDEELEEIIAGADGEVSIDLSGVTDVTDLVLPGNLVEALSESDRADGMVVSTADASISMSAPVLDTIADAITGGNDTVAVKLTAVEEEDLTNEQQTALDSISQDAVIVEVTLVITHEDGSTTELHQLGGDVEVSVTYEGEVPEGKYIVVCYLSDDGNVTYVRATYDAATKVVTFHTNHFSDYAVFLSDDPMVTVEGGSGSGLYQEGSTVTIKADTIDGYRFYRWEIISGDVTLADANKQETTFVMPGESVALRATYQKNSTDGGHYPVNFYTITVMDSENGEVSASRRSASAGISVTLTVKADAGYALEHLRVTDRHGNAITVTAIGSGLYVFQMPNSNVYVTASFSKVAEAPDASVSIGGETECLRNHTCPMYGYTDLDLHAWYHDGVHYCILHDLMLGTSTTENVFSPDNTATRATIVTILWRLAGSPEMEFTPVFADVDADDWYADAVMWAVENGITLGCGNGSFGSNDAITREQILSFLHRYAAHLKLTDDAIPSMIAPYICSNWAENDVIWAHINGLLDEFGIDMGDLTQRASRVEIAELLYRFCENIVKEN